MLSINTNLSSLIAQRSMTQSTNSLNLTIERMTTGFKINHSRDNAANYSISTNMDTQISSYNVAEDNCAMGLDMLTTASGSLDLIHSKLQRLRDLALQSANDTYGSESQKAINEEANAIVDEVKRVYNTAEYNGKNLFTETNTNSKFIAEIDERDTSTMTTMTELVNGTTSATNEYSISTTEELVALANYVNSGKNTRGMTFVLGADIDLSSIPNWTPIGDNSNRFKGSFDGNGHIIKNLTINNETKDFQGLFGYTQFGEIKNVGIENFNIIGLNSVGGLVGNSESSIANCYATGKVSGQWMVGGLLGIGSININDCFAVVTVNGNEDVGGLVGRSHCRVVNNCYTLGSVRGNISIGGLVGTTGETYSNIISNCYTNVDIAGNNCRNAGGLIGTCHKDQIINSYTTGGIEGSSSVGGLIGGSSSPSFSISSCYSTGSVFGETCVGGLVGYNSGGGN